MNPARLEKGGTPEIPPVSRPSISSGSCHALYPLAVMSVSTEGKQIRTLEKSQQFYMDS